MARPRFYPAFAAPPPVVPAAPAANTTYGSECVAPVSTRRRLPQQPPGECLPPGPFTATAVVPRGADVHAPQRINPRRPVQYPAGETPVPRPPDPVPQGWAPVAPTEARRRPAVRSVGSTEVFPPPPVAVNTTFGGECFAPVATRRLAPQQPPGQVLPAGLFAGAPEPEPVSSPNRVVFTLPACRRRELELPVCRRRVF